VDQYHALWKLLRVRVHDDELAKFHVTSLKRLTTIGSLGLTNTTFVFIPLLPWSEIAWDVTVLALDMSMDETAVAHS
jgi:hypothetical protein